MRILLVVHGFVPEGTGGVELRCYYLARELAKSHEVSVFCRTGRPDEEDYTVHREALDGISVVRVNYNFRDCRDLRGIYLNPRIDALFESHLDTFRPEAVHIHHLTCLSTNLPAILRRRGIATVMSLHDFWLSCPRGQIIRKDLRICDPIDRTACLPCLRAMWPGFAWPKEPGLVARLFGRSSLEPILEYERHVRKVLQTPNLLFTPCEFHRRKFIELGAPEDRIRTMPYGLPKGLFEGVAARRRPADRVRVGYIGSVIPTKGVHVLVEAFEGLEPGRATLDIYGETPPFHGDTSYGDRIRARCAADRGIRLHGRYENRDLPNILATLDVLVVPSVWYETFSITIREGFLAGVPVVASRLGAMGEAIEDGVTGLLFEPGDASDLHEKLDRLVRDPGLRERLAAAPKNVKGIAENAAEIAAIYRGLADRTSASR